MNKQRASGRKDGYACISGLVDICERLHYEQCTASQSIRAAQRRGTRLPRWVVPLKGLSILLNKVVISRPSVL